MNCQRFQIMFFILLVSLITTNVRATIELTNIEYKTLDKDFAEFEYAYIKAINRTYKYLSAKVKFFQFPIKNIAVHLQVKKKANGYKPFLYNFTADACKFMKTRKNPVTRYFYSFIEHHSNINHTCPYNHDWIIEKIDLAYIENIATKVLPVPDGDYAILTEWIFYNKLKLRFNTFVTIRSPFSSTLAAAAFNCSQPPNFSSFDVNSCCRIPQIDLGNAPQRCAKYIDSLKNVHEEYPSYTHVCYPECIYRETGSLVNDEIKIENVKNFLQMYVNKRDKDIIPHIVNSFEACLANIKAHMQAANIKSYAKITPEGCSPYASMVYGCVNAETFLHCPTKMWKNERNCNLAKSFAEQCNPLPHVPLPAV